MEQERVLNVSELEPPEPMEKILDATEILTPGQYLRVLHNREPFPLYSILEENGFKHRIQEGRETLFEIFIWRRGDSGAEEVACAAMGSHSNE